MNISENDYELAVTKTLFVRDNGNGHWEKRITVKRRIPKIRMSKKERIKKRWEGRVRFC
jgi:hypothetical protein